MVHDALRAARARRLKTEFTAIQTHWTRKARRLGLLTARDLRRYLAR